ncbi:hypothetical protein KI613_03530 [Ferribacterium limneticum]|nr:hypothetical protein KI613_03530 [Ferribacterium limneticum]
MRRSGGVGFCAIFLLFGSPTAANAFQSPADLPAITSALSAKVPLLGVARAGERVIAVGIRGHIVYSDDEGKNWKQASVPVSTDLVAVSFPDAKHGWAVGHGGVVIHTSDGGVNWVKQVDGKQLAALAVSYYEKKVVDQPSAEMTRVFEQAKALATDGSTQAFLDVNFESETSGFVVGAFNRIFRTEDGGKTWMPWMDRTGNVRELHFYSIRNSGGRILLTGEQGMVWELDATNKGFEAKPTPYKGTLFGSVVAGRNILVFGMRGSLFRSSDGGNTWGKVTVPSQAGITGGIVLDAQRVLLVSQAGVALFSRDGGLSFEVVKFSQPMSYFGIAGSHSGMMTLVGSDGVKVEGLPQSSNAGRGVN